MPKNANQAIEKYSIEMFKAMQGAALPVAVEIGRSLEPFKTPEAIEALNKELDRIYEAKAPEEKAMNLYMRKLISKNEPEEQRKQLINLVAFLTVGSVGEGIIEEIESSQKK